MREGANAGVPEAQNAKNESGAFRTAPAKKQI
jgi:hypothetical protein